jgi:hypothetical protein
LWFENWPYPKDRALPDQEKIRTNARTYADNLGGLWTREMIANASPAYKAAVKGWRELNAVDLREALADWQSQIITKNQDKMLDPTKNLRNPLARARNELDKIPEKANRDNLEAALSAISLVVSYKLKAL